MYVFYYYYSLADYFRAELSIRLFYYIIRFVCGSFIIHLLNVYLLVNLFILVFVNLFIW